MVKDVTDLQKTALKDPKTYIDKALLRLLTHNDVSPVVQYHILSTGYGTRIEMFTERFKDADAVTTEAPTQFKYGGTTDAVTHVHTISTDTEHTADEVKTETVRLRLAWKQANNYVTARMDRHTDTKDAGWTLGQLDRDAMTKSYATHSPDGEPPLLEHQGSDRFLSRTFLDFTDGRLRPYGDKGVVHSPTPPT